MLTRFLLPGIGILFGLLGACHRQQAAPPAGATASLKPKEVPAGARPASAPQPLRFGSGGGFVGSVTTFMLYPDGRLTRKTARPSDTTGAATPLRPAPAEAVKRAFAAFDALPADSLRREPGNMYYFLEGSTSAGRPLSAVWGSPGPQAPHAVRALYRDLMALTAQQ